MTADRSQLIADVLDEMTLHGPAGMMKAMRRLPAGPTSLIHLHLLMVLDAEGGIPMGVIAEALHVSQASATGIVDRMVQRALVERQRDATDRRLVRVVLAEAGRRLLDSVAADRRERLIGLLETLETDDLAALLRGTRALRVARERHLAAEGSPDAPEGSADTGHPRHGAPR